MALWTGLGQAATVAQLVGADICGLISMIMQAALTARQNRMECEQLARRVLVIAQLLPHVQDPQAARSLAGMGDTLREAHELVMSCQGRNAAYKFVMAGRQAERFREVQSKIDFYLILFPVISHISVTRRLERIYHVLVQDDSTSGELSSPLPQFSQLQELAHEVLLLPHVIQEFTLAEILDATNKFALDAEIGCDGFGTVYRGRLHDGREVAVKRKDLRWDKLEIRPEIDILSRVRHKHIIRLLGWCVSKEKRLLSWRRKEPEELIVCEYMENGTLFHHLHSERSSSVPSPVTVSWKTRIDVLLGVSRAIEHMHCHASPPIIHRNINSLNICLDASWVPRVSDFGLSVPLHMASEAESLAGTRGYLDPGCVLGGGPKLTNDVYSFGVVMLEVLTGKQARSQGEEEMEEIAWSAPPIIEAGNFEELLDKRPVPEPNTWQLQLQALEHVAHTALCCVKLDGDDRPAISDVVASLEMAHELICRDDAGSVDEPPVAHTSSVPSAGSLSHLVHHSVTELCSH